MCEFLINVQKTTYFQNDIIGDINSFAFLCPLLKKRVNRNC